MPSYERQTDTLGRARLRIIRLHIHMQNDGYNAAQCRSMLQRWNKVLTMPSFCIIVSIDVFIAGTE